MPFARRRRLIIALVAGGCILLALIAMGIYGLLRGPAVEAEHESRPASAANTASTRPDPISAPHPIAATSDPERFARSVARSLFDWDTRAPDNAAEWAQSLVDVADAEEAVGVATDVRAYLPASTVWKQLQTYGTRQRLDIETVEVPDAWTTARAQASAGQISKTTVAYTVTGTAHREGVWNRELVESSRLVSFTVFIDCPTDVSCRLLRLSRPDAPLQ
ncbi:hypothetical protein [Agromyces italicus]|uniref:hypothetical protein n=1 Tax=Agromyces italicus TaxID=279572 RepID=UPI0003B500FC|nr:hypothetical protein [Agromyces italicus]